MPIRAILFDKDGVLIDIQKTLGPATCDVLARLSGDRAMFRRLAEVSRVDAQQQRLLPGCPVISEATDVYGTLWARTLGRPYTDDFGREIDQLFLEATLVHLHPIGDPHAILSALQQKGYRLGVMTNDAEANTWAQLRRLGIGDSPHDLVAARGAGAVAIGVLSGPNDATALAPTDVLLPSILKLEPRLCGAAARQ